MSTSSAPRPEVLVDRSLGIRSIPELFRRSGYRTLTLNDVFGERPVPDTEWIQYAGERGMFVACKDDKIRSRPAEREALQRVSLRVLCLTRGDLRTAEQMRYFENNLERIETLWRVEGPWVFGVYEDELRRLNLPRSTPAATE